MALAITSITPATGPVSGGTRITIAGTDLDTVDFVVIGGEMATIISQTTIEIKADTPAHAAASVAVQVIDNDTDVEITAATPFVYSASAPEEKLVSTGANKWRLDVDASELLDGSNYIPVRAIKEFTPGVSGTKQDDSDYDGDGWGSNSTTQRNFNNVVKLGRKKGINTGNYDPGQEVLRDASDQLGEGALVRIRWYDRNGGPEAFEGYADVEWSDDGGDTTALSTATVTLAGNGKRTRITNPVA